MVGRIKITQQKRCPGKREKDRKIEREREEGLLLQTGPEYRNSRTNHIMTLSDTFVKRRGLKMVTRPDAGGREGKGERKERKAQRERVHIMLVKCFIGKQVNVVNRMGRGRCVLVTNNLEQPKRGKILDNCDDPKS